tara:strand:+ start:170 stop:469 length:300 start_codon:yes stop_codon:yes gene_type:complete
MARTGLQGTIKSSKPSISSRLPISPSKNVLHVNEEGTLMERGGDVYMTQSVTTAPAPAKNEDIFLPVVCTDSYGNLQKVVRSTTAEDVYEGQPLKRIRE